MRNPRSVALTLFLSAAWTLQAQSSLPSTPVALDSLTSFRPAAANWKIAGDVAGDPRTDATLATVPGTGVLVSNPTKDVRSNLLTSWQHGDINVDLDFLIPPHSNSGIYLQGRYEVQILDSWGVKKPTAGDCGAIYDRWDESRPKGQKGYGGSAPIANACRAPGLWQHLHIEFRAPRFDSTGKKLENARFAKVELNGFLVQDNVEIGGPTRSAAFQDEKAEGPLMIQGDHGPVAIRSLAIRKFDTQSTVQTEGLSYKLYAGTFKQIGDYDSTAPTSSGGLNRFSQAAVSKKGHFALVIEGKIVVPRAGDYTFSAEAPGGVRLLIDGNVAIIPVDRSSTPGTVTLTAGSHRFRLDFNKPGGAKPSLAISASGPEIERGVITSPDSAKAEAPAKKTLIIEPEPGRIRMQRSFVPFEPKKRLYAVNVGSPTGAHYAYDFASGCLLRAWRGDWLDTGEMWIERGEPQLAKPAGPSLTFDGKPFIAFIESAQHPSWPEEPDTLWSSQGYTLEKDGQPVFLSTHAELKIRDRIAANPDGKGLSRTVTLTGKFSDWQTYMLLAEGATITPQPGKRGWIIGDRQWYIDWPVDSPHTPVVQTTNGQQQLVVHLSSASLDQPLSYGIVW